MKKRELSPIELERTIALRKAGAKWTGIQNEIGVDRRAVKRAYEEWEVNQEKRKEEEVRFRVVAEAYHEHLESLTKLAEALSNHLSLPIGPDEARSADQCISNLWQTSILGVVDPLIPQQILSNKRLTFIDKFRQIESNERLNFMLFKSLQTHTGGKIRWQALDEWKEAWDSCRELFCNLKMKGQEEVTYVLNKEPDLLQEIKKRWEEEGTISRMALAIVYAIWESVILKKFNPKDPIVKVSFELIDRIVAIFTEKELNKKLIVLCNDVLETLLKEEDTLKLVKRLCDEVHEMRKAMDELAGVLNRLVLYPIILHTKCDLCPA